MAGDIIGLEEACRLVNLSKWTIYSYVCRNRIPYVKLDNRLCFDKEELAAWKLDSSRACHTDKGILFVIEDWMISELGLSGNDLIVYACMHWICQKQRSGVFSEDPVFIAKRTNLPEAEVQKSIASLERMKAVQGFQDAVGKSILVLPAMGRRYGIDEPEMTAETAEAEESLATDGKEAGR